MRSKIISTLSFLFFFLGITCFYFLYTVNPILPLKTLKLLFVVFGGLGIILNLLQVREDGIENSNLLQWIGILVVFTGLIGRTFLITYLSTFIYVGIGIIAVSFFFNPFKKNESNSDILDE